MTPDAALIAKAILMLKTDVDYAKDYVFPVALSFFSALMGGITAYYINDRQEKIKAEREKLNSSNSLMMISFQMINTLVAIKGNYIGLEFKNPLQRALAINEILFNASEVNFDIGRLSFIKKIPTSNKTFLQKLSFFFKYKMLNRQLHMPSDEEIAKTWRNIARIDAFLFNYNFVLNILLVRNKLDADVRERLSKISNARRPYLEFHLDKINEVIGATELSKYIDLTENLVSLIDFLIKEIDSFIINFPQIAESNIELTKVNKERLSRIVLNKPAYLAALIPIVQPDFELVSLQVGMSQEEAKRRYSYSAWY
ncbi:hypothetical protein [Leclercia tamurae]|uniref:hypothetical protein n=1 Tax=Leclercia tamurae TaxID=2926467 RepID=UPI0036F46436